MKLSVNKDNALSIFFILFVLALTLRLIFQLKVGYPQVEYFLEEWMINYQGGFVRRGISGEVIYQLYNLFGISPRLAVILISLSAYLFLCLFFIKSFVKKGLPIFILPFVFFLGNPVLNDFWIKKDCLLLICFIASV